MTDEGGMRVAVLFSICTCVTMVTTVAYAVDVSSERELAAAIQYGSTSIYLTKDIYLTHTLNITGASSDAALLLDGRGFKVDGMGHVQCINIHNRNVTLRNIVVTHGNASGTTYIASKRNSYFNMGGGIFADNAKKLVLERVIVANNFALYAAGGIYLSDSNAVFSLVDISRNKANTKAGGVYLYDGSTLEMHRCLVSLNSAGYGGGMQIRGAVRAFLSTFSGNVAVSTVDRGAALHFVKGSFSGIGLSFLNNTYGAHRTHHGSLNDFSGDTPPKCLSSCPDGSYGLCSLAVGSTDCHVNCQCRQCEAGTSSTTKYAVTRSVCKACPSQYTSLNGSTTCRLAAPGRFISPESGLSLPCPAHAHCQGGDILPWPVEGFWIGRPEQQDASVVYPCFAASCSSSAVASPTKLHCWAAPFYNSTGCTRIGNETFCCGDELQCGVGSMGVLCGSCLATFSYSSILKTCISCSVEERSAIIFVSTLLFLAATTLYCCYGRRTSIPKCLLRSRAIGIVRQLDTGELRILWGTSQIIHSVSWNTGAAFPYPFSVLLTVFSFFSFEFTSLDCWFDSDRTYNSVYIWASLPVLSSAIISLIFYLLPRIYHDHRTFASLVMVYVLLPPTCRHLLQPLKCVHINGRFHAVMDTSLDCNSASYLRFKAIVIPLAAVYFLVPLMFLVLLRQHSAILNPKRSATKPSGNITQPRTLLFLYDIYRPGCYAWEVVDLYRRLFFVSTISLFSSSGSIVAALGMFTSLFSFILYREVQPYKRWSSNILACVAQLGIVITYGIALLFETGQGLNSLALGVILLLVNLLMVVQVLLMISYRHETEDRARWAWKRQLTEQELDLVQQVMSAEDEAALSDPRACNEESDTPEAAKPARIELHDYLIKPDDVQLKDRIGSGSFGDVFMGECLGQLVAIKIIRNINKKNLFAFKSEIILTASLRHPNIVNFVGACWGDTMTCLIIEWVPRGTLEAFLKSNRSLRWDEPLLRLASDVARGMRYLHGRHFYDENTGERRHTIIHRDLKPENCLVTEFLTAKISDFGTSRSKSDEAASMTAVGTPLFCAGEISRGESYGEKVDVYSFGLLLLAMAVEEDLLDFISTRWAASYSKKIAPVSRVLRAMIEESWRPVTEANLVPAAPASINALIIRCMSHDPTKRPSFDEILDDLSYVCRAEIEQGSFARYIPAHLVEPSEPAPGEQPHSKPLSPGKGDIELSPLRSRGESDPNSEAILKKRGSVRVSFSVYDDAPDSNEPPVRQVRKVKTWAEAIFNPIPRGRTNSGMRNDYTADAFREAKGKRRQSAQTDKIAVNAESTTTSNDRPTDERSSEVPRIGTQGIGTDNILRLGPQSTFVDV